MVRKSTQLIGVKPDTKERLENLGTLKDTFDSVIQKLLDFWDENH